VSLSDSPSTAANPMPMGNCALLSRDTIASPMALMLVLSNTELYSNRREV